VGRGELHAVLQPDGEDAAALTGQRRKISATDFSRSRVQEESEPAFVS
jgi:hypothetical protein